MWQMTEVWGNATDSGYVGRRGAKADHSSMLQPVLEEVETPTGESTSETGAV